MIYNLSNIHDAAKKPEGINSEDIDETPGRISIGNSIAPYREIHGVFHQQLLQKTLIDVHFLQKLYGSYIGL